MRRRIYSEPEPPSPPFVRLQSVPLPRSRLPYLAISSISQRKASASVSKDGITFALAWDALMACCDEQSADNYAAAKRNDVDIPKPTLMVDNLRHWRETATALSPQEVEIVMNLRRRGATPDEYVIFLDVNAEDNPGAWSVDERKRTIGDADTLGAAWDERF
jgi:hypothetical protein